MAIHIRLQDSLHFVTVHSCHLQLCYLKQKYCFPLDTESCSYIILLSVARLKATSNSQNTEDSDYNQKLITNLYTDKYTCQLFLSQRSEIFIYSVRVSKDDPIISEDFRSSEVLKCIWDQLKKNNPLGFPSKSVNLGLKCD